MNPQWIIILVAAGAAVSCIRHWTIPALGFLALLTAAALGSARREETDALTGLGNRHRFRRRRRMFLHRRQLAAVYFDLDHLKVFNDTHGHTLGDRLLQSMSQVLREASQGRAELFRMGGDEFLAVLDPRELEAFLDRWHRAAPKLPSPASLGHAAGPGREFDDILIQAEEKMYRTRLDRPKK